jgi:hypothetical protein
MVLSDTRPPGLSERQTLSLTMPSGIRAFSWSQISASIAPIENEALTKVFIQLYVWPILTAIVQNNFAAAHKDTKPRFREIHVSSKENPASAGQHFMMRRAWDIRYCFSRIIASDQC